MSVANRIRIILLRWTADRDLAFQRIYDLQPEKFI